MTGRHADPEPWTVSVTEVDAVLLPGALVAVNVWTPDEGDELDGPFLVVDGLDNVPMDATSARAMAAALLRAADGLPR